MASLAQQREWCIDSQIAGRGISDAHVLAAMRAVPRELFVPQAARARAYEDCPLAIGAGQTISQPYIVAYMVAALELKGGEKVLEIGAGSGYAAAVLGRIAREVYAIERIGELAARAAANLRAAGAANVHDRHADGTGGWPEVSPFDAILVSAGAPQVPMTLFRQLMPGGRMVIPVGRSPRTQALLRVRRGAGNAMEQETLTGVRFVPLIGEEGWTEDA